MPTDLTAPKCGFYGKLPMRGDFVTRGLPPGFVTPWDDWLQRCLSFAQAELGEAWLDLYLNCPIWRFAIGAEACGPDAAIGVMIPSVDAVGRYFPLIAASLAPASCSPLRAAADQTQWFDEAEAAVLRALDDDVAFDQFETGIAALPGCKAEAGAARALPAAASLADGLMPALFRLAVDPEETASSVWWTSGTPAIEAMALSVRGLPEPRQAAALVDGQWAQWGWSLRS